MLEEQVVSFKVAKLAKEKGLGLYTVNSYCFFQNTREYELVSFKENKCISAPTQTQLQAWLREIHDIHIQILIYSWSERTYYYKIHSKRAYVSNSSKFILDSDVVIGKYVDVLEKALHHGLNLIKE